MDKELEELLRRAAQHVMTPGERWDQRVSFVYGQMMENPIVTRDMVVEQVTKTHGPRPAD